MTTLDKHNLNNILKNIKSVTTFHEHYDYIMVNTTCPINYCEEFLVLYIKPVENGILVTDLNNTLEDAQLNGIPVESLKLLTIKHGLEFDGTSVFTITQTDELKETFEKFFNLIKNLEL